ncbi:EscU/YscU/HrcU family type III secretion system export apparatus switch protein [Oceanicoccus sagamiensis]|uniref:Flagellar biosynthetic protein FlhB n=1 Tax=Oceanicoccus sagamiensis TaxID=716816 RepID=A0A1X9NIX7_9GAMM|nr:EscU/YscU/HrcU family type III secretion system export apparatus switch protein [Oceanicoccus sagamiensis]ARN75439.1 flagellar biosynthesis protein FlhB [Oceanicoccus sagamiensis]
MSEFEPGHKERKAAALQYDGKNAPTVSAAASGELAEEIIEIARQHGIPLFENEALLKLLMDIGVGEEIPETLYLCIAQVIAFAYQIQGKFPEGWDPITESVST